MSEIVKCKKCRGTGVIYIERVNGAKQNEDCQRCSKGWTIKGDPLKLIKQIKHLNTGVKELRELLEEIEFADGNNTRCFFCWASPLNGHAQACVLQEALHKYKEYK